MRWLQEQRNWLSEAIVSWRGEIHHCCQPTVAKASSDADQGIQHWSVCSQVYDKTSNKRVIRACFKIHGYTCSASGMLVGSSTEYDYSWEQKRKKTREHLKWESGQTTSFATPHIPMYNHIIIMSSRCLPQTTYSLYVASKPLLSAQPDQWGDRYTRSISKCDTNHFNHVTSQKGHQWTNEWEEEDKIGLAV